MASINGVSLKKVKKIKDHDGATIAQGELYIDGKRAGFWSQDAWGSPDRYDSSEAYDIVRERAGRFASGYPKNAKYASFQHDPDIFMGHLLDLINDEKQYKKFAKEGYTTVLYSTDGVHSWYMPYTSSEDAVHKLLKTDPDLKKSMTEGFYKNEIPTIYTHGSLDSFNVICDAGHPAGDRFVEWL